MLPLMLSRLALRSSQEVLIAGHTTPSHTPCDAILCCKWIGTRRKAYQNNRLRASVFSQKSQIKDKKRNPDMLTLKDINYTPKRHKV